MVPEKNPADAPPPKPQFFRILLPGSDFTTKLSLPLSLTKYFIKEKHKRATILSPLGKSWSIKVHGNINTLFFGDGWQDFALAHDLAVKYILVFSYEGDMVFNVAIFDPNGSEKEYFPIEKNNVTSNRITIEAQTSANDSNSGTSKLPTHSQECMASEPSACLWEQPFKVTMGRSYVGPKSYMNIPRQASRYLRGTDKIVLRDPEERLWHVKLCHSRTSMRSTFGFGWLEFRINNHLEEGDVCIFELISKEKKVMMHVNIQKHDEQNLKNISNRRTIEARKHLTSSSTQPAVKKLKLLHSQDQKIIPHSFQEFMASKPSACLREQQFTVTMRRSYIGRKSHMNIPCQASHYLWGTDKIVLRDPEERLWPVKLYHWRSKMRCAFGFGWLEFCLNNNLKEGDVCIFELISKEKEVMLHVHIQKHEKQNLKTVSNRKRSIEAWKHLMSSSTQPAVKKLKLVHSQDQKNIPHSFQESMAFEPIACLWEQPFKVTMGRSYIGPKSYVIIPRQASHYLWGTDKIVLRDPQERLWPVKLLHRLYRARMRSAFGCGWLQFRINNHLEKGDVCIFELISKENKFTMHVHIQKHEKQNLKNISNNKMSLAKRTIEARKHLASTSTQPAVKKLKPVHSQDQKVSESMGLSTPASLLKATIKSGNLLQGKKIHESMASEPSACLWEQPFKVTMRRSYIGPKSRMNIPRQASRYLWGTDKIVLVDPEERLWPVKLYHIRTRMQRMRSAFGCGWLQFRINNHLEKGDVCIFELISKENKVMMRVHIQKHEKKNLKKISNRKRTIEARKHLSSSSTQPAVKKIKLVHSQDQKNIPHSFELLNDLHGVRQITLRDPKRWRFPVNVFHRHQKSKARTSFDPSTCEKDYIPMVQNDATNNRIKIEEQISANDSKGKLATRSKRTSKLPAHSLYCKGSEQCTCLIGLQFKVIIRPSYIGPLPYMHIPSHAPQYLFGIEKIVLRDPEERVWPVKLHHRSNGRGRLRSTVKSDGWKEFHVTNNLEVGDVCIFELVSKEKNDMMDVHIQKHGKQDSMQDSNKCSRGQRTLEARKYLTSSSTQPAVKKVKLVNSQDQKVSEAMGPSTPASLFKATIKSGNLLPKRPYMNIPSSFRLLNDLSGIQQIILRDPKRRRWPVEVIHRQKKTGKYACFGFGWQDFCASNNLEEGDVCVFELIETSNVMVVDIIKEQLVRTELQSHTC